MARELHNVIDQMLLVIPERMSTEGLISRLKDVRQSIFYVAPELHRAWWTEVAKTLHEYFGDNPPIGGWQKEVCNIWSDKR
ncbi:MAG: hypothetical protein ACXABY_01230 [Candidatus Thorarchaeota archaeon]|jgi:hypothetical protein